MGSDSHYVEESPAHNVRVDGYFMDEAPVTNRQFAQFVQATGYVTCAEVSPNEDQYPGADPSMLRPGSLVFTPPAIHVDLSDCLSWWTYVFGADWRHPLGPGSNLDGLEDHPVVHVALSDAQAYANWVGKQLPTEAEWEFAAKAGGDAEYAWGSELAPGGVHQANTWQGQFPVQNLCEDGYARTSPVFAFPPNSFGLRDMIGNVWEWTSDYWMDRHSGGAHKSCCIPSNPRNFDAQASIDIERPQIPIPRMVLKGGSHLCSPNYCRRYRPAARQSSLRSGGGFASCSSRWGMQPTRAAFEFRPSTPWPCGVWRGRESRFQETACKPCFLISPLAWQRILRSPRG